MANRTYISTTTRRSPKPRSERLRAIGAGSVTSTVISLGGSSGGGTAGEDGFSPTISFETEGSVLTVRVVNKTGIKEYEIDLGECTGVDALREDFEECCREMTEEVRDLRDAIDELKRMMNVVTFTIVPTPADAKVTINGEERASVSVLAGAEVEWRVEADGYITRTGSQAVTEDTTLEVVLADMGSLISSFSYDDIGAGGGSVLPKVETVEGASLTYSGTGVDKDTGAVSADSLGTTVKARTRVTAVTLTAELNGSTATATADVYQEANEVVRHEATGTTYGKPSITGGHTYDDIDAGGGTVTPTAPAYNQAKTTGYTDTYTSGATAPGEEEDEIIRSGADITYSGTGVDTSTGAVTAPSLGTTLKERSVVATSTVTVTMNGQSASKETDVYQQENEIVSTSDEETYGTPSASLSYEVDGVAGADIPAGGGTARPALSYSQTHTTGHSETYTSGEVATDGTTETITTGAEVSYGSEDGYPGATDPSSGAVAASSLGTAVQGRSISASVVATVTMNGKSGTAAAVVWQEENKVESESENTTYEDLIIRLRYSVDGVEGADIPAGGGTATPDLSYRQEWYTYATYTYTSGATSSEKTGGGTDTGGGDVVWSGEGVDTSAGAVTAPSLGTTVKERTMVAEALATVTLNGVTDAALCRVYQQENEIVSTSDEETYGTPSVSLSYEVDGVEGADIPAGGGTARPALSYSQTHTTGHSETYTSGEVATDGTTETITSGAEVSYGSEDGYPGATDPSSGAVTASSLGTAVQGRSISAAVVATVTMNGKSGTAAAVVWQEENKVEITGEDVAYGEVDVLGFSYPQIPASGGTVLPDLSYRQQVFAVTTRTYTSGETDSSTSEAGYVTDGGTPDFFAGADDEATGAVTAPSLGTEERERTCVTMVIMYVTGKGGMVSGTHTADVYQEENKIESITRSRDIESLVVAQFSYPDIPGAGGTVYPETGFWYEYEDFDTYTYTSGESRTEGNGTADVSVTPDGLMFADNTLRLSPITLDTATGAATAGAATSTERQSLTTVTAAASYTSPETGEELVGSATSGVWQEPRETWLRADPDSLTFGADGGLQNVDVDSSSGNYTIEGTSDVWLTANAGVSVGGGLSLSVTAASNTETSARSGSVTLANGDGCAAEVAVTQEGASSGGGTGDTRTLTLVISQRAQTETWTRRDCPTVTVYADGGLAVGTRTFSDNGVSMTWTGSTDDGAQVEYTVSKDGYTTVTGSVTMDSDMTVSVILALE